jgi:hypothetical protein
VAFCFDPARVVCAFFVGSVVVKSMMFEGASLSEAVLAVGALLDVDTVSTVELAAADVLAGAG